MSGPVPVTELRRLLSELEPIRRRGSYLFVTLPGEPVLPPGAVMAFAEDEGLTVIVTRESAEAQGWPHDGAMAWITLGVVSDLAAVGLTAAVSGALAEAGISCNMVAARYHDHLFVPEGDAVRAMDVLTDLSARAGDLADGGGVAK